MKYFKILSILLFSSVIAFYACNDNSDANRQEARESLEVSGLPTIPNAAVPNPATSEPLQNTEGVWHYTCSKGCVGGGGKADNCATCGGALVHNSAYHANANSTPATNPTTPSVKPPVTEPVQNTAGVWHYTCSKGCAGGGGKADNCATCGGSLVHNSTYH